MFRHRRCYLVTDASAIAIHDAAVEVNQKEMFEKTVHL
jgi:hypothetical protein